MFKFFPILIFVSYNVFILIGKENATETGNNTTAGTSDSKTKESDNQGEASKMETDHVEGSSDDEEVPEQSNQSGTQLQTYTPFILMQSILDNTLNPLNYLVPKLLELRLPTRYSRANEEIFLTAESGYLVETPLCPDLKTKDSITQAVIETIHTKISGGERCLFVTSEGQETCSEQPRASFHTQTLKVDGIRKPIICGTKDTQNFIAIEFFYCGNEETLTNYGQQNYNEYTQDDNEETKKLLPFEVKRYPMYKLCYDFEQEKALWAVHEVKTPALLAHDKYPYKYLDIIDVKGFSTDTHDMKLNRKYLEKLKKSYTHTEVTQSMAHNLVPREHMALPYWKQATSHIINTAPLYPKFKPLMKAINDGIFKAYAYALTKFHAKLKIYTKQAETKTSKAAKFLANIHLESMAKKVSKNAKLSLPNKWYKFIHDEKNSSGILIVLHNTGETFEKDEECERREISCNFPLLTGAENKIPEETLSYAYCCKTSSEQIKELFSMTELSPFRGQLDLEEMVNLYPTVKDSLGKEGLSSSNTQSDH